jgi:hypothetical protein
VAGAACVSARWCCVLRRHHQGVCGVSDVCRQCETRTASHNAHHYQLQCKALKALQFWCCRSRSASFSSELTSMRAFMFQLQAAARAGRLLAVRMHMCYV